MNCSIIYYRSYDFQKLFRTIKLPKFHFGLSGGYWSHIQEFQKLIRWTFIICRAAPTPKMSTQSRSNILRFIKMLCLEHVPTSFLLAEFQFMLFDRYWYHISRIPFMLFDRHWSHIQDFQDFVKRFLLIFGARLLQKCLNFEFPKMLGYVKILFKTRIWDCPCIF